MKIIMTGKNIEITDGLRAAVEDKIGKLDKYFAICFCLLFGKF